ncbi:MAG: 2-succinyl-5-enolpyruvyl-6-hydroxy-3-cyclohexene-1-carboxylic-acid synthase [Spirochaetaceae bacterium]|nr:2-succinyl-5-enolpyruvyl-6-hydroxy-3-cyclohexene-1-carboxylic-acid synthase [Spirochaetaceae bacterium]
MAGAFEADSEAAWAYCAAFFEALRQAGVEHVVISPGSRSTPLAIVAEATPGLRTWIVLDERSAAFFGLGLGRASRRPAALVCTSGTAAANYLPAIVEAHHARVPLVVLTADRPPELRDWGAGQTIEQTGLFGRHPRWAAEVPIAGAGDDALRHARRLAARAVAVAVGRPAGAVHLNWPFREPLEPPAGWSTGSPAEIAASGGGADVRIEGGRASGGSSVSVPADDPGLRFTTAGEQADPADVAALVALARQERAGVVCCGPMDPAPGLARAIRDFARAAGWPVLADPASSLRGGCEGGDPIVLAMGDALARAPGFVAQRRPRVVLRLGEAPVSKAQRLWLEAADPAAVWWLDEGQQWGEPSRRATRVVRGGAASLLSSAADALGGDPASDSEWCRAFVAADQAAGQALETHARTDDAWSGLSIATSLARRLPGDATLFASNSMAIRLLDLALPTGASPLRVFANRGASGIDGVTSTALGVAAAGPGRSVLLTGDLAFLHDLSGLLLARREPLPLTIVVLDDDGGGIFSFLPIAARGEAVRFDRLFRTPHGVDLAQAAPLFGLPVQGVDSLAAFESAFDRALDEPGVSIVHARLEPRRNAEAFRAGLAALVAAVDATQSARMGRGAR